MWENAPGILLLALIALGYFSACWQLSKEFPPPGGKKEDS